MHIVSGRRGTFAFLVPPSRCELLLVRSLSVFFFKNNRGWSDPDRAPRSRDVADGRRAPDAGQRDTLFPILAPMRKPKIARTSLGTAAMMHAAGRMCRM